MNNVLRNYTQSAGGAGKPASVRLGGRAWRSHVALVSR